MDERNAQEPIQQDGTIPDDATRRSTPKAAREESSESRRIPADRLDVLKRQRQALMAGHRSPPEWIPAGPDRPLGLGAAA